MTFREVEMPFRECDGGVFLFAIVVVAAQFQNEGIGEVGDVIVSRGGDFSLLAVVAGEVFDFSD